MRTSSSTRKVTWVLRTTGFRAANLVVQLASNFESTITVDKDGIEANAKSIMGLLLLAAGQGSQIVIRAQGRDAKKAIAEIGKLIEGKFGEKEPFNVDIVREVIYV